MCMSVQTSPVTVVDRDSLFSWVAHPHRIINIFSVEAIQLLIILWVIRLQLQIGFQCTSSGFYEVRESQPSIPNHPVESMTSIIVIHISWISGDTSSAQRMLNIIKYADQEKTSQLCCGEIRPALIEGPHKVVMLVHCVPLHEMKYGEQKSVFDIRALYLRQHHVSLSRSDHARVVHQVLADWSWVVWNGMINLAVGTDTYFERNVMIFM